MEEDEEDLYSEMQLEEGRRRSINSHNTLKVPTAHLQPVVARGRTEEGREDREGRWMEGWRKGGKVIPSAEVPALSHRLYNQAHRGFARLSSRTLC